MHCGRKWQRSDHLLLSFASIFSTIPRPIPEVPPVITVTLLILYSLFYSSIIQTDLFSVMRESPHSIKRTACKKFLLYLYIPHYRNIFFTPTIPSVCHKLPSVHRAADCGSVHPDRSWDMKIPCSSITSKKFRASPSRNSGASSLTASQSILSAGMP